MGPVLEATVGAFAVAIPALLALSLPPSATFLNQAAALVGWAAWLLVILAGEPMRGGLRGKRGLQAMAVALAAVIVASLGSALWSDVPWSLALSAASMVGAALFTLLVAAATRTHERRIVLFQAFCIALAIAGAASAAIGILQVYVPELTGSDWIAASTLEGRAVGNLRQPNHLSSLLLWSMIAVVWLGEAQRLPRWVAAAGGLLMLFCLVLTGSRTGMLGTLLLAGWGMADRGLSRRARILLVLVPLVYAMFWFGVAEWAHSHDEVFGGETQLHRSDISSSRFGIWKNTLALIAAHPWVGVGFGEFNFAWSLTPFPDRPTAFFDHTHNLPLQLAVELGLPLAALLLALLAWALYAAWRNARDAGGAEAPMLRAAFVMVLMITLHSQLEYPLWYAYFLLPAAFAFGLCLGGTPDAEPPVATELRMRPLMIGALMMLLGSVYSVLDYHRVVVIFSPPEGAGPLADRIADGRRSLFFGHHADYAAATTATEPAGVLPSFATATHYLLDTRLMMAWANALNDSGDVDRARHLAQRLREFRNPQSDEFFAPCKDKRSAGAPVPFQCEPPLKHYDYRDFR
jgi:O-antigen ligase